MTLTQSDASRPGLSDVEAMMARIDAASDPALAGQVQQIVQIILGLHKDGIERVVERLSAAGPAGEKLLAAFADDPIVSRLLQLYDLHPVGIEERVGRAVEKVRPFLQSHGGDVEVVAIADETVHLRMRGACDGCPALADSLKLMIEQALHEAAADAGAIVIETAKSG